MIQRQLEQVEEKQRQLEERGVAVEKALRGEADYWGESNDSEELDLHLGVMGRQDDPALMQQWFKLVQQKNCLMRYESELMILWERAVWSAIETASSVDLLGRNAIWSRSRVSRRMLLM
uniref:BMERB domain-containing protein n=1 Tax=Hucho hucho TaxID=62062 RepID=A0A4W5ND38_9TELE